jgi:hypothetical protein
MCNIQVGTFWNVGTFWIVPFYLSDKLMKEISRISHFRCCPGRHVNAGVMLINPTLEGKHLFRTWMARLHHYNIATGRLWNHTGYIEQEPYIFDDMWNQGSEEWKWNKATHKFDFVRMLTLTGQERVYRVSRPPCCSHLQSIE